MTDWKIGSAAWFIVRNLKGDGWMAVQRKIARIEDDICYADDDISAPAERLCETAADAFRWISLH